MQHSYAFTTKLNCVKGSAEFDTKMTAQKVDWFMDITGQVDKLEFASSVPQRLRGMLFRDPDDVTRILVPCRDVHTFGMRYPLDIAFISKDGYVLDVFRNVSSKQRLRNPKASIVAERFSKQGEWLKAGDVIKLGGYKNA